MVPEDFDLQSSQLWWSDFSKTNFSLYYLFSSLSSLPPKEIPTVCWYLLDFKWNRLDKAALFCLQVTLLCCSCPRTFESGSTMSHLRSSPSIWKRGNISKPLTMTGTPRARVSVSIRSAHIVSNFLVFLDDAFCMIFSDCVSFEDWTVFSHLFIQCNIFYLSEYVYFKSDREEV